MRKILLFGIICILSIFTIKAQNVGINSTGASPDASAGLDVSFTNKGLLIPRVALTATNVATPITSPTTSLLVYNTATASSGATAVTPGYYYWTGTQWSRVLDAASGKPWLLTGNAGTVAGTNFIGTTDAIDFVVRTNNTEKLRVQSVGNVGIGTATPAYKLDVGGGHIRASGEIISTMTTGSGQFRAISGNYGTFIRNDGNDTYLPLITASGDQYGSWNSLRPLRINNATGDVYLANSKSIFRHSDGNVGVGTISPGYPLTVTSATADRTGSFTNTEASNDNYAVYGECATTDYYGLGGSFKGGYMGVKAIVSPSGSNNYYGVYNSVSGGSGTNYGVYSYTNGSGTNYGVLAYAYNGNHNDRGVQGVVNVTGGHGIIGYNETTSQTQDYTTSAVYGRSTYDVNGMNGSTIYNAAVQGWDTPPNNRDGIGVFGSCWPSDSWGYGGWFNAGYYGVRAEGYSGDYYKSGNLNDVYSGGLLARGMIGTNSIGSKIGLVTVSKELGLLAIGDINSNAPAAFFDGAVIRNGYEAMLIDNGEDNVPAYTMVSNKVNIQTAGQALLNNGSANINFDYSFSSTVSSAQPIIVIITPTAQNTGNIVVITTSANGFNVVSDNSNSNGTFNWMAIGTVKGYENTSVKQEYVNTNFVNDKADAIYPNSKDFSQFKSDDFFKTEKLNSTVKEEKPKDKKLHQNAIIMNSSK